MKHLKQDPGIIELVGVKSIEIRHHTQIFNSDSEREGNK